MDKKNLQRYVAFGLALLVCCLYAFCGVPLVPLSLVWVNTHGSSVLLPFLIGAYAVSPLLKGEKKVVGQLMALVGLVVTVSFVDPLYRVLLRHEIMKETTYLINEWQRFSPIALLNFGVNPVLKVGFFLFFLGALFSFYLELKEYPQKAEQYLKY